MQWGQGQGGHFPPCKYPYPIPRYPGYQLYISGMETRAHQRHVGRMPCLACPVHILPSSQIITHTASCLTPPVLHPCHQQINAISQPVKTYLSSHSKSSWPKTGRSPKLHQPTAKLEKTVVLHSMCPMLPLADHSSVWTCQEFRKDLGHI